MPAPLMTIEDLASTLATTPGAIRQARHRGASLPQAIRIGRRLLWRPEDVDAWLETLNERDDAPAVESGGVVSDLVTPARVGEIAR